MLKKAKFKILVIVAILVTCSLSLTTVSMAANKYWIGGTGNWSNTDHWATTSGGSTTIAAPAAGDVAVLRDDDVLVHAGQEYATRISLETGQAGDQGGEAAGPEMVAFAVCPDGFRLSGDEGCARS